MVIKARQVDREQWISDKAEEIAQKWSGCSFDELPPQEQMRIWANAEQEYAEMQMAQAERIWDELELERMLGN